MFADASAVPSERPDRSETLVSPSLPVAPGRAFYLGLIEYEAAWRLQLRLLDDRMNDRVPDLLLLCQHPDVLTIGRRQRAQQNILEPRFPVFEVERGGDATYHGPGQLVGYPILKLRPGAAPDDPHGERDLHRYLRAIEGALIDLCAGLGVVAGRSPGATGVWTLPAADDARSQKLASLGIAVRRWVTFHGFALNVTTDLGRFSAINPCGFQATVMTSLAACGAATASAGPLTVEALTVEALIEPVMDKLGRRLNRQFTLGQAAELG